MYQYKIIEYSKIKINNIEHIVSSSSPKGLVYIPGNSYFLFEIMNSDRFKQFDEILNL